MHHRRNLARRTAVVFLCAQSGRGHQARRKRKSPRSWSRCCNSKRFLEYLEDDKNRNHVAPRMKLSVPKHDFPISVNYVDVQRQMKTSIDVLRKATSDDNWNIDGDRSLSEPWLGVTRWALLNKKSTKRTCVCSSQTAKKHYKTETNLARRMIKYVTRITA